MIDQRIKEIEGRWAKATPGPWRWYSVEEATGDIQWMLEHTKSLRKTLQEVHHLAIISSATYANTASCLLCLWCWRDGGPELHEPACPLSGYVEPGEDNEDHS